MKTTKDYLEAFDQKFKWLHEALKKNDDELLRHYLPSIKNVTKQFLSDTIKEVYFDGYKQGVEDEIKCVETSGEHANIFPAKRDEILGGGKNV